jgi:hypothetical protein
MNHVFNAIENKFSKPNRNKLQKTPYSKTIMIEQNYYLHLVSQSLKAPLYFS